MQLVLLLSAVAFFISGVRSAALPNPISKQSRPSTQTPYSVNKALMHRQGITTNLLTDLNLFGQYAGAAYCKNNFNSSNGSVAIQCPPGNCPMVQDDLATTVLEFENSLITDVTGFVATDTSKKLVTVAFRGSYSIRNILADIDVQLTPVDLCEGCEVHGGFWQSWLEARDEIVKATKDAAKSVPGYRLVVTGHSLGAAIATLAAAELRNSGYNADLFAYGSPRVGNPALAQYVSSQPGQNYRVTHHNDPIPQLPFIFMGYEHITPEYYIGSGNGQAVMADGVTVLQGFANLAGNAGQIFTNLASHLWYFNSVCACGLEEFDIEF